MKSKMSVTVAPQPEAAVAVPVPPAKIGWGEIGYGDCCEKCAEFPMGTPKRVNTPAMETSNTGVKSGGYAK